MFCQIKFGKTLLSDKNDQMPWIGILRIVHFVNYVAQKNTENAKENKNSTL